MKIVFFETEDWEKEFLKSNIKGALLLKEKITSANAYKFRNYPIISTFINSRLDKAALSKLEKIKKHTKHVLIMKLLMIVFSIVIWLRNFLNLKLNTTTTKA